jgi:hypothetical protein
MKNEICPGCGQANRCGESANPESVCWCMQQPFLPLADGFSMQACWCQQCLQKQLMQKNDDAKPAD